MLEQFIDISVAEPSDHDFQDWMIRFRFAIDRFSSELSEKAAAGDEYSASLRAASQGLAPHIDPTRISTFRDVDRHSSCKSTSTTNLRRSAPPMDIISSPFSQHHQLTVRSKPEGRMALRIRRDEPQPQTTRSTNGIPDLPHSNASELPSTIEKRTAHGCSTMWRITRSTMRTIHEPNEELADISGNTLIEPEYGVPHNPWLPNGLGEGTLSKLRHLMTTPPDGKTGYLYALEVTGHGVPGRVLILLGQTKDIISTMKRWNKVHSSRKASLKTLWPLNLNDSTIKDDSAALKRFLKTHPEKIRCYERVTKLVETELAQYRRREPCIDCTNKTEHRRLFAFPDDPSSGWEDIVVPVVDKWRLYYTRQL